MSNISKSVSATPFSTVVIDAGHGGFDRGGIRQNLVPEKDMALDVVLHLRERLSRAGLKTVMTRSDDRFVTLGQRIAIANAHPEAIFVSIHFNAGLRTAARGVETFYASTSEAPLAARIQRHLARTTNGENRGIKRASFYVLRRTKIRAVLAECGFLTNPWDAALAQRSNYRQDLAKQISLAIVEERNSLR
jgi:N-acetylmuramoyl-L-alanine amidase